MIEPRIRVLGSIDVEVDGAPVRISKSRLREILALLVTARGTAMSTSELVAELWDEPATGAVGAVRTFVGELRRILEPDRPARTPPAVLVTVGDGYALRVAPDSVDLWRAERMLRETSDATPETAEPLITAALAEWRGTAFEEFASRPWAQAERARLAALRADSVERLADARLALGRAADAIPLLDRHVAAHPWREGGWRLLALALYRDERRGEALGALRRARRHLADELGLDPGIRLAELERGILRRDRALDVPDRSGSILLRTASAHVHSGARAQLESVSALLPGLAVSGELRFAMHQRIAAIHAAEELGDPELTARVIGSFDVPGVWTRSDDPAQSAAVVDAALRTLSLLSAGASERSRARLLATVAMESRGTASRGGEAREAERIARKVGDPQLLCFALSARYMQCFETAGLAHERKTIAAEIVTVAHAAELPTFEINGRVIRMQALCALDDIIAAGIEADAIDALAVRHERPLATVFTGWFRSTFTGGTDVPPSGTEMPGFAEGIAALARLAAALRADEVLSDGDFGPYEPWVRPLLFTRAEHRRHEHRRDAAALLDTMPSPPHDLLLEVLWTLVGRAALDIAHAPVIRRAHDALRPAATEWAAGSAVVDLGPVSAILAELAASL